MKLPKFNDKANTLGPIRGVLYLLSVLFGFQGDWRVMARCVNCGRGTLYAQSANCVVPTKGNCAAPTKGANRWLCACGAGWEYSLPWVGRKNPVVAVWQWKPLDELPQDFQALYTAEDTDDDMDARIRARVEVEVASERARLLAQHAATCNCRRAQPSGAGGNP